MIAQVGFPGRAIRAFATSVGEIENVFFDANWGGNQLGLENTASVTAIGGDTPTVGLGSSAFYTRLGGAGIDINNRFTVSSDGVVRWGDRSGGVPVYGVLTWDTGKAIVEAAAGKDLVFGADATQFLTLATTGLVTKYKAITTAGWGVPAIYGSGRATAQTAANATVATYTVGAADGSFVVQANVNVTTSTTHSFTVTCIYTDETNASRTLTLSFTQLAGTILNTITNLTGAGPYEGFPTQIRCKAATSITIGTQAAGTYTAVTYNVEGSILQVS